MAFRKNAFRSLNYWGRNIRHAPSRREAYGALVDVEIEGNPWDFEYGEYVFNYPKIRAKRGVGLLADDWNDISVGDYKRRSWKNTRRHQYRTSEDGKVCDCCGRYVKTQQDFGDTDDGWWYPNVRQRIKTKTGINRPIKRVLTRVDHYGKVMYMCKYCLRLYWPDFYGGDDRVKIEDYENG